jgi:hypothetical protein
MDRQLAIRILDLIETLNVENLALRSLLVPPHGKASKEQVDALVSEAKRHPGIREMIRAQWKPLRDQLESDKNLEEAFREYLKIVPQSKGDVN